MSRSNKKYMNFGKYIGSSRRYVVDTDPRYALWANRHVSWFSLTEKEYNDCRKRVKRRFILDQAFEFEDDMFPTGW